jgi:hypothetical protein
MAYSVCCTGAGRRRYFSFVLEQADGVLSCAAVLRGGLGPPTPPLCRYAEYTADPLSGNSWRSTAITPTDLTRSSGNRCAQRSGIKGEPVGRRTAAELCTPIARACTVQKTRTRFLKRMPNPKISSHASTHRVNTTPHRQSD